jgi:hypothetical protein
VTARGRYVNLIYMKALLLALALATPACADAPRYFGYSAIECGLDDIWTKDTTEDGYTSEVAAFTNLNMACVHEDPAVTAERIRRLDHAGSEIILNVQAALFDWQGTKVIPSPARDLLWPLVVEGIRQSGVSPDRIILYLIDEPALSQLPTAEVTAAATFVRTTYPGVRTMSIDALIGLYPHVPPGLTYWGFDAYFHRDPAKSPEFVAALDRASAQMDPDQHLVLIVDATHFWLHDQNGFSPEDMGEVARNYAKLALARSDIDAVIAHSWVGGIDDTSEMGVRDMPLSVQQAHREVGRLLLGR